MHKFYKGILYAGVVLISSQSFAAGVCPNNYKETSVSGYVQTANISETLQIGTVQLTLLRLQNQKVEFDQLGAIVGTVTDSSEGGAITYLDHSLFFGNGTKIQTEADVAQIIGINSECSFDVLETITNFTGTKDLQGATGSIIATGTVNFPPCGNQNSFTLSGTVCLK